MAASAVRSGTLDNENIRIDQSTALLTNNSTYTSNTFTHAGFARVTGLIFSDQAGSLNIDQSTDGTNWDYSTTVGVAANTGTAFSVELVTTNARVRFQNTGGGTQTVMRFATFLRAI